MGTSASLKTSPTFYTWAVCNSDAGGVREFLFV